MTLPPMPDESFFDGGDPQSKKAPGDPDRELIHEVRGLSQNVLLLSRVVRHVAATSVPRPEIDLRRRGAVIVLLLCMFSVIWIHDQHVENCSPGARVTRAVDWLLANPAGPGIDAAERQRGFAEVYNQNDPICEVTFPLHSHDGEPWPHVGNLIGIAIYSTIALVGLGWFASAWLTARPRPSPDSGPLVVRIAALIARPFQAFEKWITRGKGS